MPDPTQAPTADPGSAAPAADPNASPQGAVPQIPAGMVMVPMTVFDGLNINPKDTHNLRARLQRYEELDRNGFVHLADTAGQRGTDGHILGGQLAQRNWALEEAAPQPEPAPDPSAQVGYVPPYDASQFAYTDPGQQYVTPEAAQRMVEEAVAKATQGIETKFSQTLAEKEAAAEKERAEQAAYRAQDAALAEHLKALGYERKPVKTDDFGQEAEIDPMYDDILKPSLMEVAYRLFSRTVHPNDEDAQEKLSGPIPPEFIRRASEGLKPRMSLLQQTAAQVEADRQQTLPHGAVPAGAGGRPQKPVADMDPDEVEQEVIRRRKARGATYEE